MVKRGAAEQLSKDDAEREDEQDMEAAGDDDTWKPAAAEVIASRKYVQPCKRACHGLAPQCDSPIVCLSLV